MRVFLIASTPYGYLHHRFQKLADYFRDQSIPLTYIEQTYGWRAYLFGKREGLLRELGSSLSAHVHALRDLLNKRTSPAASPAKPGAARPGAFEVVQLPLVIPANRLNSRGVERLNAAVFRHVLLKILSETGETEAAAIVDNPLWGAVLNKGDFARIYYDCIDDVALYAGHATLDRFLRYEERLVAISDAVFVTAEKLEERLRGIAASKPLYRIPNGVDFEWFQKRVVQCSTPDDISSIRRPIVGYMGSIADWMDYRAVNAVARRHPGVSFVFVGPVDYSGRAAELERSPNVYWLGRKPYIDVPAYIGAFDVCWIPFLGGRIVDHTDPIKLYEYFALGKPVASSPFPEIERYRADGLVYTGSDPDSLSRAVDQALQDGSDPRRLLRMAVAREHSWSKIAGTMKEIVTRGHA